jgi:hypothetical protein
VPQAYGLVKMIKSYEEQPIKDRKGNVLEMRTICFLQLEKVKLTQYIQLLKA